MDQYQLRRKVGQRANGTQPRYAIQPACIHRDLLRHNDQIIHATKKLRLSHN
jgi:hypothetical protein